MIALKGNTHNKNIYDIKIFQTIFYTISIIGAIYTIYLIITTFKGIYMLIAFLVLIIIILTVLLILYHRFHNRLKDDFGILSEDLVEANDNRDTMDKVIDNKNEEVKLLEGNNFILKAQIELLYQMMYSKEKKPNPTIVEQAFKIEGKGMDQDE